MSEWTYSLHIEVDWAESGWDDAADLQADLVTATCSRGFSGSARDGFVAPAGEATIQLLNAAGQYSRHNASGPYFGNLGGGKPIRLRISSPVDQVIWVGRTYRVRPSAPLGDQPTATIIAKGQFVRLSDERKVTPVSSAGGTTDTVLAALFDAAGVGGAERDFDTGEVTTGPWAPGEVKPFDEARLIVATEQGRLYERKDGVAAFERRHYRRDTTRSNTVQLTWSDDPADVESAFGYRDAALSDPEDEIYDRIKVDVTPTFAVDDDVTTMAQFSGVSFGFTIGINSSRTFTVNPFNPGGSPSENGIGYQGWYVVEWEDPTVSGGDPDITVLVTGGVSQADLSISAISTTPTGITFTLTNASLVEAMSIGVVRLRGIRAITSAPIHQIVGSGYREYPLPGPYYATASDAMVAARWLSNYYGAPRDLLTLETTPLQSEALFTALLSAEIGDRWHVTATGLTTEFALDDDFFLEQERWTFDRDREVSYGALVSACLPNTHDADDVDPSLPSGLGIYYRKEEATGAVLDSIGSYDQTRHGTTRTPALIAFGQDFDAADADYLVNSTSGLPDTNLNDAWEWNGFFNVGADSGDDQIIMQKAVGEDAGYSVYTQRVDATHQYLRAMVWNGTTVFTTPNTGVLLTPGTTHFWRLWHDPTLLTIYLSLDLAAPSTATYTGSIVSPTTGIVFGGTGTSGGGGTPTIDSSTTFTQVASISPATSITRSFTNTAGDFLLVGVTFHRGVGADFLDSITYDGDALTILTYDFDNSDENEAALVNSSFHAVACLVAPSIGTHDLVITWQGTNVSRIVGGIRTFSGVDPVLPYSHMSITHNDVTTISGTVTSATGELVVDTVGTAMGIFSQRTITAVGGSQTEQYRLQDSASDNGCNAAGSYKAGAASVTMTWTLDSSIDWVSVVLSLQGTGSSLHGFNSWQDEVGFWPTRFLSDTEASARYNGGTGSTVTGGEGNSYVPPTQPPGPGLLPPGPVADRPVVGPPNSFYFATDEQILYGWNGTAWIQVAPEVDDYIPESIIDAKGDLIAGSAADTPVRVPLTGSDGDVLTKDSGEPSGMSWQAPASSGAPTDAHYVTSQAEAGLTAELVLGTAVIMAGVVGSRPAASIAGRLYFATDVTGGTWYRDNGATWDTASLGLSALATYALLSDLTSYVAKSSFVAKGDLLVGTGAGTFTRLAIGNDNDILVADSTETLGLRWGDASGVPTGGDPSINEGWLVPTLDVW